MAASRTARSGAPRPIPAPRPAVERQEADRLVVLARRPHVHHAVAITGRQQRPRARMSARSPGWADRPAGPAAPARPSPVTFHTITSGPSVVASSWLSLLKLSARGFSAPGSTVSLPFGNRHRCTLLSWQPDATTLPSGLHARLSIDPFASRCRRRPPDFGSKVDAAVTRARDRGPSGDQARPVIVLSTAGSRPAACRRGRRVRRVPLRHRQHVALRAPGDSSRPAPGARTVCRRLAPSWKIWTAPSSPAVARRACVGCHASAVTALRAPCG